MAVYKKSNSGYLPFIQKEKVTSPFTDIQNRAKVDASLKTVFGNERIHVNSLNKLNNEFGPNGEVVYEPDNGDSRIRFVGNWETVFTTFGQYISTGSTSGGDTSSYLEVTFYGTGLNVLFTGNQDRDFLINVDGVSYPNLTFNNSDILGGRNYKSNSIYNAVSGLSLGWHTVKVNNAGGATFGIDIHSLEIVNESSQITVKSGKAHGNGYEYSLDSDQLIDYNLGFDNVLDANIGNKGGRVVVYMDPADGSIKKRLTKTDSTAQYLANTDHSNESIYRVVNFREFGRNRADDFSTLSTSQSDRGFTLDDGTTTLVSNNTDVPSGFDVLRLPAVGSFYTITFVGTGLAFGNPNVSSSPVDVSTSVEIDGVNVGDLNGAPRDGRVVEICSGLPYGTHTVKIETLAGGQVWNVADFIIYQPKKPELPEGAIELADYNILGDFVANTSQFIESLSQGVLRKSGTREQVYGGGTFTISGSPQNDWDRFGVFASGSGQAGAFIETTFFGTGFDFRFFASTNTSTDVLVTLNGQALTAANFPTAVFNVTSNLSAYNDTTGSLNQNSGVATQPGSGFMVSGLPLGHYTVRLTNNDNSNGLLNNGISPIVPIHAPHTHFGSLSLRDVRNFDSQKDINKIAKEEINYVIGSTTDFSIRGSKGVSQVLRLTTGEAAIYFEEANDRDQFDIQVAGQASSGNGRTELITRVEVRGYTSSGIRTRNEQSNTTDDLPFRIAFRLKKQKDKIEESE